MREGLIRRTALALVALSLLLLLTTAFALTDRTPSANAADSETAQLIGFINAYRSSHGIATLSTSADANADAQTAAVAVAEGCNYGPMYNTGHNHVHGHYGYSTAETLWGGPAYAEGSPYLDMVTDSKYKSIGVGRGYGECFNPMWVIILDRSGGGGPTPTPTATPSSTPSKTPSPTPSKTPSPTPSQAGTPTATPSSPPPTPSPSPSPTSPCADITDVSVQCTQTPPPITPTPTFSAGSPTPTPLPNMPGDADCDLDVDSGDGILALMLAANLTPDAPCLGLHGVNCQGLIDITDVLAILSFVGDIPFELPDGCPPLGTIVTPAPTPSPTPTGTPVLTETPVLTDTPTPTQPASATPLPSVTPVAAGVHHCLLALVSYEMDTGQLSGDVSCTPDAGPSYVCSFGNQSAACVASSTAYPDYDCTLIEGLADCIPPEGDPEYQCFLNTPGAVECLPTHVGYASYECAVSGGTVSCTTDPPFTDFVCTKQTVDFNCAALP